MNDEWMNKIKNMADLNHELVPEYIWENVKPHLPKKRRTPFWIFPLLASGILLGTWMYTRSAKSDALLESTTPIKVETVPAPTKALAEISNSLNVHSIQKDQTNHLKTKPNSSQLSKVNPSPILESNPINKVEDSPATLSNSNDPAAFSKESFLVDEVAEVKSFINDQSNILPVEILESKSISLLETPAFPLFQGGVNCYSFSGGGRPWLGLEVYAGPGYNPHSLSDNAAETSAYIAARKNTESSQLSFVAGIRAAYHKKNWTVRAGLMYQQIYEQFNYINNNDYKIVAVYQDSVLVRLDTLLGTRTIKTHNFHRMIHLPLSVSYGVRIGRSFMSIQPGIGINLYSTHRGRIYQPSLQPGWFTTGSGSGFEIYKTNVGFFGSLDLNWYTPLYDRLGFFVEPGLMYFVSPFNKKEYNIKENYFSVNLKLGLSYQIK